MSTSSAKKTDGRISGSWKLQEIEAGAALMTVLLVGGDPRILLKRSDVRAFARGVARLAARAAGKPRREPFVRRRMMVIDALREHGKLTARQLAALLGLPQKSVSWMLQAERLDGTVRRTGVRGYTWEVVPKPQLPVRLVKREAVGT